MLSAGHFSLRTYLRQEEREQRYRALYGASREMQRQLLTNEESMKLSSLIFQNSGESMMVIMAKKSGNEEKRRRVLGLNGTQRRLRSRLGGDKLGDDIAQISSKIGIAMYRTTGLTAIV